MNLICGTYNRPCWRKCIRCEINQIEPNNELQTWFQFHRSNPCHNLPQYTKYSTLQQSEENQMRVNTHWRYFSQSIISTECGLDNSKENNETSNRLHLFEQLIQGSRNLSNRIVLITLGVLWDGNRAPLIHRKFVWCRLETRAKNKVHLISFMSKPNSSLIQVFFKTFKSKFIVYKEYISRPCWDPSSPVHFIVNQVKIILLHGPNSWIFPDCLDKQIAIPTISGGYCNTEFLLPLPKWEGRLQLQWRLNSCNIWQILCQISGKNNQGGTRHCTPNFANTCRIQRSNKQLHRTKPTHETRAKIRAILSTKLFDNNTQYGCDIVSFLAGKTESHSRRQYKRMNDSYRHSKVII